MKQALSTTFTRQRKVISLEDYAFYQGAQKIPLDESIRELDHRSAQEKSKVEAASELKQKPLEALLDRNATLRPQVNAAWEAMRAKIGDHPPTVWVYYLCVGLAVAALIVDTILTAPGLDALGIANPILQYVAAFGMASLSSVIFHMAAESFTEAEKDPWLKLTYRLLAAFAIISLLGWGILRGREVALGADLAQNPLGGFLHGHPISSSILFCFITLGAPLTGALAGFRAGAKIHEGSKWQRAHREHQALTDSTSKANKALELERATLEHKLMELDAVKREWQACFVQYHRRGDERGGRQEPFWTVLVKSGFVGLLGGIAGLLLGPLFSPLYLLCPGVAFVGALMHFRRARLTPSYRQLRRIEDTRFSVPAPTRREISAPQPRLIEAKREERKDRP